MLAMQKKNLCLQSRFFQSPGKKGSGQIMYQCTRNWGTIKLTGKWRLVLVRLILERLRFTFTPNGKRDFVPRDQVFPLIFPLLFIVSTQK